MALELKTSYATAAATVYAIVRRPADSKVWNTATAAWATWADGTIASYDVALTDKGGDLYQGDFPSTIDAGNYRVLYYVQAGGAPAITDTLLETVDYNWNGVALTDASVVTLSAYALTTVVKVKRLLGITASTWDDLLTELVNAWTDRLERICERKFASRTLTERYGGHNTRRLVLVTHPVISITSVKAVYDAGVDETTDTIAATEYRFDPDTGVLELIGSRWASWQGNDFASGFRNFEVVYVGGFATIPDELDMLCRELVVTSFRAAQHDRSVTSESVGSYNYSNVDAVQLETGYMTRLARWRNVPLAQGWY